MSDDPIYVTKPDLPPLDDFVRYLEEIWNTGILTNNGPFHERLEQALCDYLGVQHLALLANGTMALMTALRVLNVQGEVITTPFSFVATAHALLWNGLTPVFVDIDPKTLNLDARKIEAAITSRTTAIMPVHCFGTPCDVDTIGKLANKYGLRVVYDAAHAFGVRDRGGSILRHGDLSVLSFHATKVFSTFEGGAIICPNKESKERVDRIKNFGIVDELTVEAVGVNGKMNEVSAAFGLLQLEHVESAQRNRHEICNMYRKHLENVSGISCTDENDQYVSNYSYFPILVESTYTMNRDALYEKLKRSEIFCRRYFFPLISRFPMYRKFQSASQENLSVAQIVSEKVLCLPIYSTLSRLDCKRVCDLIAEGP